MTGLLYHPWQMGFKLSFCTLEGVSALLSTLVGLLRRAGISFHAAGCRLRLLRDSSDPGLTAISSGDGQIAFRRIFTNPAISETTAERSNQKKSAARSWKSELFSPQVASIEYKGHRFQYFIRSHRGFRANRRRCSGRPPHHYVKVHRCGCLRHEMPSRFYS